MALGGFITIEFVARAGDGKLVPDIDPADLEDLQRFQGLALADGDEWVVA